MSPMEQMRGMHIKQMKEAIEFQSASADITRRKIEAMQDEKKTAWRELSSRIALIEHTYKDDLNAKAVKEQIDALKELRRAKSCVQTCEIEQVELNHTLELKNLDALKEQLVAMEDPSPLLTARLMPKPGLLS